MKSWDDLNEEEIRFFLAFFHYHFYYGPNGNNFNYLDLDERVYGESVKHFCIPLINSETPVSKMDLYRLRNKYYAALDGIEDAL